MVTQNKGQGGATWGHLGVAQHANNGRLPSLAYESGDRQFVASHKCSIEVFDLVATVFRQSQRFGGNPCRITSFGHKSGHKITPQARAAEPVPT